MGRSRAETPSSGFPACRVAHLIPTYRTLSLFDGDAGDDQLLAACLFDRLDESLLVPRIDLARAMDDRASGNVVVITGRTGPFGPSAALVVMTVGSLKTYASFARAVTLVMYSGTLWS
jgi:hypothetical protein